MNVAGKKRGEAAGKAWGFVLVVFAASHPFHLIAGALLVEVVPVQRQTLDVSFEALSISAHFDGEHYTRIAESGYGAASPKLPSRYDLASQRSSPLPFVDAFDRRPVRRACLIRDAFGLRGSHLPRRLLFRALLRLSHSRRDATTSCVSWHLAPPDMIRRQFGDALCKRSPSSSRAPCSYQFNWIS